LGDEPRIVDEAQLDGNSIAVGAGSIVTCISAKRRADAMPDQIDLLLPAL
jgi:hypothetical protein